MNESHQPEPVNIEGIENLLAKAKALEVHPHEAALAQIAIEQALDNARQTSTAPGLSLAAAFDLIVAVEYYTKLAHNGWLYCPGDEYPLLLYPYTNTCPRCVLKGNFYFHQANKLPSGIIGKTTSRLLCVFLQHLFNIYSRNLTIHYGCEPVDVIIHDETENIVLLAEVKAAPLTTLALAVPAEVQKSIEDEDELVACGHAATNNPFLTSSELHILLPKLQERTWGYDLVYLGVKGKENYATWTYQQIGRVLREDEQLFYRYFQYWHMAYSAYNKNLWSSNILPQPVYWLTNACGQPMPRPSNWPRRKSGKG